MRTRVCEQCHREFTTNDRKVTNPVRFCSRACIHESWKGRPCKATRKRVPLAYKVTESGCHECTSHSCNQHGYPTFSRERRKWEVHRYLFQEKEGRQLAYEEVVCHTCHNKLCINVDHMYLGNKSSNALDAVRHGSWNKKLSEDDVRFIKSVWGQSGITADKLARKFGVTRHAIYHITKTDNNTWARI